MNTASKSITAQIGVLLFVCNFAVSGVVWCVHTAPTSVPPSDEQWNQTYGGTNLDRVFSVIGTSDGGYLYTGVTASFSGGLGTAWLVKGDTTGAVQWNKTYGGVNPERGRSVIETSDGGYLLAGNTRSYGAGSADGWLVKVDATGIEQWNQTYTGTIFDRVQIA